MRYYVLTTAKFADQCLSSKTYGSTNSNWLANINIGDIVFISQFNYKSQNIFGPFITVNTLFYDKKTIFPNQRYYYRIKIGSTKPTVVDETCLYLQGIKEGSVDFSFRLISLIQQNKHLHSISLTNQEGQFIIKTLNGFGQAIELKNQSYLMDYQKLKVDIDFLIKKNNLEKKPFFSSESDLETYILLNLKDKKSILSKQIDKILMRFPNNTLDNSEVYNQFIFGNAYPADLIVLNKNNINIFELKKDNLDQNQLPAVRKEIKKHCYYSLFSKRLPLDGIKTMNFFLVVQKSRVNLQFQDILKEEFKKISKPIDKYRINNFLFLQYYFENGQLFLEA